MIELSVEVEAELLLPAKSMTTDEANEGITVPLVEMADVAIIQVMLSDVEGADHETPLAVPPVVISPAVNVACDSWTGCVFDNADAGASQVAGRIGVFEIQSKAGAFGETSPSGNTAERCNASGAAYPINIVYRAQRFNICVYKCNYFASINSV